MFGLLLALRGGDNDAAVEQCALVQSETTDERTPRRAARHLTCPRGS